MEKKISYPSPADAFGSAINASELTASYNVLDESPSSLSSTAPSNSNSISDRENTDNESISTNTNMHDTPSNEILPQPSNENRKRAADPTWNDDIAVVDSNSTAVVISTSTTISAVINPYIKSSKSSAIVNPYLKSSTLTTTSISTISINSNTTASDEPDEEMDMPPPRLPSAVEMADDVLESMAKRKLLHDYASFIMEQGDFHNWLHLAKEDKEVWPWMVSFTADLLDIETSMMFDEYYRYVMDRLMVFGKAAVLDRNWTSSDSYEYRLFHFLVSDEFELICSSMLPTKPMQTINAVWLILVGCLEISYVSG